MGCSDLHSWCQSGRWPEVGPRMRQRVQARRVEPSLAAQLAASAQSEVRVSYYCASSVRRPTESWRDRIIESAIVAGISLLMILSRHDTVTWWRRKQAAETKAHATNQLGAGQEAGAGHQQRLLHRPTLRFMDASIELQFPVAVKSHVG